MGRDRPLCGQLTSTLRQRGKENFGDFVCHNAAVLAAIDPCQITHVRATFVNILRRHSEKQRGLLLVEQRVHFLGHLGYRYESSENQLEVATDFGK